ncbi:MAG: hypothetical protein DMG13_02920 [Acidobacteria bacterium]|nr:MAG: hypothetical protein DMG13_02920 [Acidobacteriota bacterium]
MSKLHAAVYDRRQCPASGSWAVIDRPYSGLARSPVILSIFLALLFFPAARAETSAASKNPDQFICSTSLERTAVELALDRYHRQHQPRALTSTVQPATSDRGNIAVLEDDGTVITQPNPLDLTNNSITFAPAGADVYTVVTATGTFDDGTGSAAVMSLGDDDSAEVTLPFPFVFYGVSYTSVFLNSDGNLTFTVSDVATSERNLSRIVSGPPRVAPFFDDLNPLPPAKISVERLADRVLFTWTDVGEWTSAGSRGQNTFQAVLNSNGVIRFNYRILDAGNAVVGIAPGQSGNTAPALIDFTAQLAPATLRGLIGEVFATSEEIDLAQVAQIFYRTHPDTYDGLIVFSDFNLNLGDAFANSTRGIINIRPGIYDFGPEFGSPQRLSVLVNMGDLSRYPVDPRQRFLGTNNSLTILGQEFGHRWLAYLDIGTPSLLGRDSSHWSFLHNTFGSVVEGNEIEDLGDGNFRTVAATIRYSPLDQYVMGLRPASQVPPWFVVANPVLGSTLPTGFPLQCRNAQRLPSCAPFVGLQFAGVRRDVTIDEIISLAGPRVPSFEQAQKDFRVAFILVTQRGQPPKASSLQSLDTFRTQWQSFFTDAVDGRGTMNTELLSVATEFQTNITANGSRRIQTLGTANSVQVGYSVLDSALGVSVIRFVTGSDIRSEVAVPAATIGTSFAVYAERTDRTSTGIAIVNTNTTPALITAQLSDGRQTSIQLPARSQRSQFIHELFPDMGFSFSGSVRLTSNLPIGILGLRGTLNESNEFIMTIVPVTSGSTGADVTVFPQIADGSGYVTELILLNPASTAIRGTLQLSFPVATDRGTNSSFTYDIPPSGVWRLTTQGTRSDVQAGYASLTPAGGSVVPEATAILKRSTGTNLNFEAGVPAARPLMRGEMFAIRNATYRTAIAIANRGTSADVRLTAYRSDGTAVSPAKTISLASSSQRAAFIDELIPELPADFEGIVTLDSTSPVYAITLRTLVNASGAFLMTTMPLIDPTQPELSQASYFPQLVDGGNYTTEFLLLNGSVATARLQFFNTEGQPLAVSFR